MLNGHKMFVIDGHVANLIIVAARTAAGVTLFAVEGDAAGLTRTPLPTMDQTRKQARLEFADTPAVLIGVDGGAEAGLSKTLDLAAVALAAEQVGGAQRVLDASVEYAKTRIQFGRPIGWFQAIKHKCADMLLEVESAKSAAYYAAWAAAEDSDELPVVASLAKSLLLGGLLPLGGGEHPDPRRHRLHVGAPGPPLLQAGQVVGAVAGRSLVPPRAAGTAHRHLTCRGPSGSAPGRRATSPPTPARRLRARPSTAMSLLGPRPAPAQGRRGRRGADLPGAGGPARPGSRAGAWPPASLRGAGESEGDFSALGWLDDLGCLAAAEIPESAPRLVVGSASAACWRCTWPPTDERVAGVACLGTPADLGPLAVDPERLLERCRQTGVVSSPSFPASVDAWAKELTVLHPVEDAALLKGRPLLMVHGSDDPDVPLSDARALADAATGPSELHTVLGAGHWLRADPRVIAILAGWLERRH